MLLMVSVNARIANRVDFGEGEDVTDAVLAFGGDEDPAGVESELGSSADPRFPRPQYGRVVMSNGQMTQAGKRLSLGPIQGNGMGTILFFDDVMFPVPFARNGTYPRCMNFRADDPDGCLPSTIDAVIKNLMLSPQDITSRELLGAYQPTFMSSSDRLRFQPDSLELNQVCRTRRQASVRAGLFGSLTPATRRISSFASGSWMARRSMIASGCSPLQQPMWNTP